MFVKCLSVLAVLAAGAAAFGDTVVLTSGEVLKVTNVKTADGKVEMDHPVLGHLSIPAAKVSAIKADDGSDVPGAAGPPAPPPPPPPPPPAEKPRWKTKAELGLNGTSGNTRTSDLRAAIGTKLETDSERWVFSAVYLKSRTDGETTAANWYAMGLHDWLFKDSPWLAFVTARYDWDHFQNWDKRVQAGAGGGYRLFDDAKLKVRLRAGFNEVREYGGDDDGWRPEGILGADGSYKINDQQDLTAAIVYFPDLQDQWKYRVVGQAGWSVKLNDKGLSMLVGVSDEIDSHSQHPVNKQNIKYFVALIYEF